MTDRPALPYHEAANIFPLIYGPEFTAIVESIRQVGLLNPILTLDGKILDGRNRERACREAGVEAKFLEASLNGVSPVDFVLAQNRDRRHLDKSQLGMVAARVREYYDEEAKERQRQSGGDRKSAKSVVENVPQPISAGKARDKAGEAVGVSGKTVDAASRVLNKGVTELIAAVDSGQVTLSTAKRICALPVTEQRQVVASGPDNTRRRASAISNANRTKPGESDDADKAATKIYVRRATYEKVRGMVNELLLALSKKPVITVSVETCRMKAEKIVSFMDRILSKE